MDPATNTRRRYYGWTFGDRLRKAREEAGLGVQELADMLYVSRNTITRYESGQTKRITDRRLQRIAEVTGADPDWLLHGTLLDRFNSIAYGDEPFESYELPEAERAQFEMDRAGLHREWFERGLRRLVATGKITDEAARKALDPGPDQDEPMRPWSSFQLTFPDQILTHLAVA